MKKITIALGKNPISLKFLNSGFAKDTCDHQAIEPIHHAFKPMSENGAFDVSEMAIVTAMQAVDHGRDIVPLPITVASRVQHKCIIQNANFTALGPKDLEGKTVAVRAYSQTTGAWVRAILETEFDVDCKKITWVTQNPPHVVDAAEPSNVLRDKNGKSTLEQIESGLVAAAIFGNDLPEEPWVKPVIENADEIGRASLEKLGLVQINHVIAVSRSLFEKNPGMIKSLFEQFRFARETLSKDEQKMLPIGINDMNFSIETLAQSAFNQNLITKKFSTRDIFGEAEKLLK